MAFQCHVHGAPHAIALAIGHLTRRASHRTQQSTPVCLVRSHGRSTFVDSGGSIPVIAIADFSLLRAAKCGGVSVPCARRLTTRHRAGHRPSLVTRASSHKPIDPRWSRPLAWSLGSRRLGGFVDPGCSDRRFFSLVRRQVRWCFSAMGTAPHAPSRWPLAISRGARLAAHNDRPQSVSSAR